VVVGAQWTVVPRVVSLKRGISIISWNISVFPFVTDTVTVSFARTHPPPVQPGWPEAATQ